MVNYHTQLVEFPTTDDLLLPGLLFTPEKPTRKAAIFLHGNGSASVFYSVTRAKALAESFAKQGIALLLFNNRGAHFIKTINKQLSPEEKQAASPSHHSGYHDVTLGTAYELIKDCTHDIEGAINFVEEQGYTELSLVGHSSGANKICVYDHHHPSTENRISKYVLLAGGDDTGIIYKMIGDQQKHAEYLARAKRMITQGKGRKLIPKYMLGWTLSYQSFYDLVNPNGDYNTFPFLEYLEGPRLSSKPLFDYFKNLSRPSLVVYGANDDYAPEKSGKLALKILKHQVEELGTRAGDYEFKLIADTDHSFHGKEQELGETVAGWV